MKKGLVSIVSPCHNSTQYIFRLLDSILIQDYSSIEVILIDDGSNDNLEQYLFKKHYFESFLNKGYILKYFRQENAGQASAINNALNKYEGEFITWPDSDDYYLYNNVISTFVNEIESRKLISGIRCKAKVISEISNDTIGVLGNDFDSKNVFYDCILERNFWFAPICYFFRAEIIKELLGDKIVINEVGQNFQFFMPIFYYKEIFTVKSELVVYLVRDTSHSHAKLSFSKAIIRQIKIRNLKKELISKYKLILPLKKRIEIDLLLMKRILFLVLNMLRKK